LLNETNLLKYFWVDTINTACYVLDRVLIKLILKKTLYELFKGKKPKNSHLRVFGCKCFILKNGKDNLGKFDAKTDEDIYLGYSSHSHAYNKITILIEETVHITFDEINQRMQEAPKLAAVDEEINGFQRLKIIAEQNNKENFAVELRAGGTVANSTPHTATERTNLPEQWTIPRDLSLDNVIGQIQKGVSTRNSINLLCEHMAFVSQIEKKIVHDDLRDNNWISAM